MTNESPYYVLVNLTNGARIISKFKDENDQIITLKDPMFIEQGVRQGVIVFTFERYNEFDPAAEVNLAKEHVLSIDSVKNINLLGLYEAKLSFYKQVIDSETNKIIKQQFTDLMELFDDDGSVDIQELNDIYLREAQTQLLEEIDEEDLTEH